MDLRAGLGNKQGSHDYAFIGPAPSMERLNELERSPSPPYVPPGGENNSNHMYTASHLPHVRTFYSKT